jgi:hypothetical protein
MHLESTLSDGLTSKTLSQADTSKSWMLILGLILITVICITFKLGIILRVLFPVSSLIVGIFLYNKQLSLYIGFTWWIYFLTPFIARIVDLQAGWDPSRTMILAPFLVSLVSGYTTIKYLASSYSRGGDIFILPIIGLFYAFLISLINRSPFIATKALLDWLTPIIFGFHIFSNWRYYPEIRQSIQRTFLWGALIMGSYGIFQYLTLPEWDKSWLMDSGMFVSAGNPAPFEIRVWSTLNSPGPFANIMMAALLILPSYATPLYIPATVVGFLSLLLTLVRSAWGGWLIGMLTYVPTLKVIAQTKLLTGALVILLCLIPLTTMEEFNSHILNRVDTLSDIEADDSYNSRKEMTSALMGRALTEVVGEGFSNENIDSGIIEMLLSLGWIGTSLYLAGLTKILSKIISSDGYDSDSFMASSRAICISLLGQIVFGVSFKGIGGMPFWAFAGTILAASKHMEYIREQTRLDCLHQILQDDQNTLENSES